jgi:hypothetical protein
MMIWLLNISQFYNMLDINASSIQCEKKGNKIIYWNSNTQGYAMAFTTEGARARTSATARKPP